MENRTCRILYCHCAYAQVVPKDVKEHVLVALGSSDADFKAVADLCEMAARRDPALRELAAAATDGDGLRIAACFPRAVRGLFIAADAPLPPDGVQILNMRTEPAQQVVDALLADGPATARADAQPPAPSADAVAAKPGAWKPWFPVIDFHRCTHCMQCLSFCLFDVYGVSADGKIKVQNPTNCKTDCPACARVCPEVAILFPKYRFGPVNGEEVNPEDVRREAMKVDISALLGGDIYQALRDRSQRAGSRFSRERDETRALEERRRCLQKLQEALDIPPEILASLPSLDEIQSRARQAQARNTRVQGSGLSGSVPNPEP